MEGQAINCILGTVKCERKGKIADAKREKKE